MRRKNINSTPTRPMRSKNSLFIFLITFFLSPKKLQFSKVNQSPLLIGFHGIMFLNLNQASGSIEVSMETNSTANLPTVNLDVLTQVVHSALSNESAEIKNWHIQQIGGGFGNPVSVGIFRVQGIARDNVSEKAWSVILKILQSPDNLGIKDMGGGEDATHWNYWQREPQVYQSDFLHNLPEGLAAPKFYAVETLPGNIARLWLEEIQDIHKGAWSLQRYSLTARHLGRLNGFYSSKSSYPEYPWLGRDINRQWLQMMPINDVPWDHPLLLSRFPDPDNNPFVQLLLQHQRFLDKLDSLPIALSHGDTYPTNFMSTIDIYGNEQTVALDWALLGLQPLGADLGQFALGTINNLNGSHPEEIIEPLFKAYFLGLQDEGCNLDAQLVRYGFAVSASLRVGLFQLYLLLQSIEEGSAEEDTNEFAKAPDPFETLMARKAFQLLEG